MPGTSTYHQRVAAEKRSAILVAAADLFGKLGYAGSSLALVAEAAGVSKATLFKQFPTKSDLFDAVVSDAWGHGRQTPVVVDPADPGAGLRVLGSVYASLLDRPGMAGLFRLVIAEARAFPELGQRQFDLGKVPFFDEVRRYFEEADQAGSMRVQDPTMAATQMLGMISNFVLWPKLLLPEWAPGDEAVAYAVEEAVLTTLARYAMTSA